MVTPALRPPARGRPTRESNAELELRVIYTEIREVTARCAPSLDRLEAATFVLGPPAHQHVARVRYELTRLSRRTFPALS